MTSLRPGVQARRCLPSRWWFVRAAALALSLGLSGAALAQPTAEDRAAAEALFEEGLKLVQAGEIATACDRFGESQRRDPQIGTLLYLATCHEQLGKSATAWVEFKDALAQAQQSGKADRAAQAQEGVTRVEATLSKINLTVAGAVKDQRVTVNGREVRTFGVPLPYDPGQVTVEAEAPGHKKLTKQVELAKGPVTLDVEVPPLEREVVVAPPPTEPPERDRTLAYIVGGVGLGLVGVGLAFGGGALVEKSAADDHCEPPDTRKSCTQEGLDGHDRANAWAWASNVTVGVGLAAVATGVVFLFVGPELYPAAAPKQAGLRAPYLDLDDRGAATVGLTGVW